MKHSPTDSLPWEVTLPLESTSTLGPLQAQSKYALMVMFAGVGWKCLVVVLLRKLFGSRWCEREEKLDESGVAWRGRIVRNAAMINYCRKVSSQGLNYGNTRAAGLWTG